MDARATLAAILHREFDPHCDRVSIDTVINDLAAAGYTILHDSENHGPTRDRAAEICERPVIGFQDGAVEASRYLASAIRAMGEKK